MTNFVSCLTHFAKLRYALPLILRVSYFKPLTVVYCLWIIFLYLYNRTSNLKQVGLVSYYCRHHVMLFNLGLENQICVTMSRKLNSQKQIVITLVRIDRWTKYYFGPRIGQSSAEGKNHVCQGGLFKASPHYTVSCYSDGVGHNFGRVII